MNLIKVCSNPTYTTGWLILLLLNLISNLALSQQKEVVPDLSKIQQPDVWTLRNREASFRNGVVYMNARPGDGTLLFTDLKFANGTISFDVKGKDEQGKSFVGLAFHLVNDSTFDAIYFRPFNFRNLDRKSHSLQYISIPDYGWDKLRKDSPGKYENSIQEDIDPNEWIHVVVKVEHPSVKVFVNDAKEPSLVVDQLSLQKEGWLGFFVGNNSEGSFKNLKVTPAP